MKTLIMACVIISDINRHKIVAACDNVNLSQFHTKRTSHVRGSLSN
jgi:hypothetical protein